MVAQRRSVRRFAQRQVPREMIEQILNAAAKAPSSKNCRSSRFMVVSDREDLNRMAQMRNFGSNLLSGAQAAIVVMGDTSLSDLWVDNASISATYILLAAEAIGLGACWVHVNGRLHLKDDPTAGTAEDWLRETLPIQPQYGVLCVIALGYRADDLHTTPSTAVVDDVVIWR